MVRLTGYRTVPLLAFALVFAGGCKSMSPGEKMVQSFAETRQTVAESRGHVGMTTQALTNLRRARAERVGDAFAHYKQLVEQLEEQGDDAKQRAVALREESDAHIKAWQREMKEITDPAIKASLESRREAVRSNFALVRMYADDARKAYEPFLQGNKSVVQALSIDLSPAALESLAPAIDGVAASGRALDQKLAALQQALDNTANGISPLGEMGKASR